MPDKKVVLADDEWQSVIEAINEWPSETSTDKDEEKFKRLASKIREQIER